jgi:magnesium chelatase family protein
MIATTITASIDGIRAIPIQVEVKLQASGFPAFRIVGLAEGAVKESKVRVLAALSRCGYHFGEDSVTVNLAPAHIRKTGSSYDLAIAVGLLIARGVVPQESAEGTMLLGELSLHAGLRPVRGALPVALCARRESMKGVILPEANACEASMVPDTDIRGADSLPAVVSLLKHGEGAARHRCRTCEAGAAAPDPPERPGAFDIDMTDVRGQGAAKRALSIAAAGGHNLLMTGPPGSGKTMLARAFSTILPRLTYEESLETSAVYSVAGLLSSGGLVTRRPFRAPHHSISCGGLVGGGSPPRPGEVSLATNGILFLDEFPEFSRWILDLLRQPLEEGEVTISRVWGTVSYPARFTLVAAMNPCPCGNLGSSVKPCRCSPEAVRRYRGRISGPIMDRIDMRVAVPFQRYRVIAGPKDVEGARRLGEEVARARKIQQERYGAMGLGAATNAAVRGRAMEAVCRPAGEATALLERAVDRFGLSARAYTRILKIARTIADMEGRDSIEASHVGEALQFRLEGYGEEAP